MKTFICFVLVAVALSAYVHGVSVVADITDAINVSASVDPVSKIML